MSEIPKLSVVVPAHNEEENLAILLPRLSEALKEIKHEIIVVNNASSDHTSELIAGLSTKFLELKEVKEETLGYGRAVLAGLHSAGGESLGIIRADNQEKPEDFVRMYRKMRAERWNFCKAVRNSRKEEGLKRKLISLVYNTLFRLLFRIRARDINATPKIFTLKYYQNSKLSSLDWFIDAEMVIKAQKLGYKLGEVEIDYLPRLKGKSTVRFIHIFQFLENMAVWFVRSLNGKLLEK